MLLPQKHPPANLSPVPFSVVPGGETGFLVEKAAEIIGIIKARAVGDILDGIGGGNGPQQQFPGVLQPDFIQIGGGGHACILAEYPADMIGAIIHFLHGIYDGKIRV